MPRTSVSPMSSPRHLAILAKSLNANDTLLWDEWRYQNPDIHPDLSGADLHGANLTLADLRGANLTGANLDRASLRGAHLDGANLSRASLKGASLFRAKLASAVLAGTNLTGANLHFADLCEARLSDATLAGAILTGTGLEGADLSGADLTGADLTGANLAEMNFSRARLLNANLARTTLYLTTFADVDLRTTKGLETVLHLGPSSIDVSTIFKSAGDIPEVFLRGCGVPDTMIAYIRSLIAHPIEFAHCFISYSSQDEEFVQRLQADLQTRGLRVWCTPEDKSDRVHTVLEQAHLHCDKLIIVLSENSVDSAWVEKIFEDVRALDAQRQPPTLFDLWLDDSLMGLAGKWIDDVRRASCSVSFPNWRNRADYQEAFERLLRDLGDERESESPGTDGVVS